MFSTNESWRQSLPIIRDQLSHQVNSGIKFPGAYSIYFPDPMRQQRDLPRAEDFHELKLDHSFRNATLIPIVLRQDLRKVEALYMQYDVADEFYIAVSEYRDKATELVNIVFQNSDHARQLLSLPDTSEVTPDVLWTMLLFRLASLRIDGSGLFPRNSNNAEDIFQTLWPTAEGGANPSAFPDDSLTSKLWLPKIYHGSVWIVPEVHGSVCYNPQAKLPDDLSEYTLRFSPPLVLFGTSHIDERRRPALPPLVYYAWGGKQESYPTVTVLDNNGSPLPEFGEKRICSIRTCFTDSSGAADDYSNANCCQTDHPDVTFSLSCSARIYELKRPYHHAEITPHEIPLNINVLTNNGPDARLVTWVPEHEKSNSDIGYRYYPNENLFMPNLTDVLSSKISPGEYFAFKNFPLLQVNNINVLGSKLLRLSDAEKVLASIQNDEGFLKMGGIDEEGALLPQQRITNVVQILDDLFDASVKTINIVLDKGREWVWKNMEQTAPIFAEVWSAELLSQAECQRLTTRLNEILSNNSKVSVLDQIITMVIKFFRKIIRKDCKHLKTTSSLPISSNVTSSHRPIETASTDSLSPTEGQRPMADQLNEARPQNNKDIPIDNQTAQTEKKKTMDDYTDEEKEVMIDLALKLIRKFPMLSNEVIALMVAQTYKEFNNTHLSRFGKKNRLGNRFKKEAARIRSEYKGNPPSDVDNETPDQIAQQNELDRKVDEFCTSEGIPTDNKEIRNAELEKRCKKSKKLMKKLSDLIDT